MRSCGRATGAGDLLLASRLIAPGAGLIGGEAYPRTSATIARIPSSGT